MIMLESRHQASQLTSQSQTAHAMISEHSSLQFLLDMRDRHAMSVHGTDGHTAQDSPAEVTSCVSKMPERDGRPVPPPYPGPFCIRTSSDAVSMRDPATTCLLSSIRPDRVCSRPDDGQSAVLDAHKCMPPTSRLPAGWA